MTITSPDGGATARVASTRWWCDAFGHEYSRRSLAESPNIDATVEFGGPVAFSAEAGHAG